MYQVLVKENHTATSVPQNTLNDVNDSLNNSAIGIFYRNLWFVNEEILQIRGTNELYDNEYYRNLLNSIVSESSSAFPNLDFWVITNDNPKISEFTLSDFNSITRTIIRDGVIVVESYVADVIWEDK